MQVIITQNNNKSVPGFSQVEAIKRKEIIYLLCLVVTFCSFYCTFLREGRSNVGHLWVKKEKERGKKRDTKDLSLTSVLLASFRLNSAAVSGNNHVNKSISVQWLPVIDNFANKGISDKTTVDYHALFASASNVSSLLPKRVTVSHSIRKLEACTIVSSKC